MSVKISMLLNSKANYVKWTRDASEPSAAVFFLLANVVLSLKNQLLISADVSRMRA
jgi:hypothetical protein